MSLKEKNDQKKGRGKGIGTDLPTISSARIKKIIKTFFSVGAAENPVSSSKIAQISTLYPSDVSKQMRFLLSIGLVNRIGTNYKLTSKGADYAKFLSWEQEEDASILLNELLLNSSNIDSFIKSMKLQERAMTRDDAIKLYGTVASIPPERKDLKTGIRSVIDLMIESALLIEVEEGYISVASPEELSLKPSEEDIDETLEKVRTWKKKQGELYPIIESQDFVISLNVNLNISEQANPESVKEMILAIKEGLKDNSTQSIEVIDSDEEE